MRRRRIVVKENASPSLVRRVHPSTCLRRRATHMSKGAASAERARQAAGAPHSPLLFRRARADGGPHAHTPLSSLSGVYGRYTTNKPLSW